MSKGLVGLFGENGSQWCPLLYSVDGALSVTSPPKAQNLVALHLVMLGLVSGLGGRWAVVPL